MEDKVLSFVKQFQDGAINLAEFCFAITNLTIDYTKELDDRGKFDEVDI